MSSFTSSPRRFRQRTQINRATLAAALFLPCLIAGGAPPLLTIQSGVELTCLTAASNTYEPQWSSVPAGIWASLGDPVPGNGATNVLAASAAPAVEISWPTEPGATYQVKSATRLNTFGNFGSPIQGDGNQARVTSLQLAPVQFYRLERAALP